MTANPIALARPGNNQPAPLPAIPTTAQSLESVKASFGLLQMAMDPNQGGVLKRGVHYGIVPGTGDSRPSLLKPGADVICALFHLTPNYSYDAADLGNGHREYTTICTLNDITGRFLGQGIGSANTMETRYRYRKGGIVCPHCGKMTVFKSKQEFGGGWYCNSKQGGCGAKFKAGDPEIENQEMGRIEHDNPADYYNTCLKMAAKRAQISAVLTVTGASAAFTQDLKDMRGNVIDVEAEEDEEADEPDSGPLPTAEEMIADLAAKSGLTDQGDIALLDRFIRETAESQKRAVSAVAAGALEHFESFTLAFSSWFKRITASKKTERKPRASKAADPAQPGAAPDPEPAKPGSDGPAEPTSAGPNGQTEPAQPAAEPIFPATLAAVEKELSRLGSAGHLPPDLAEKYGSGDPSEIDEWQGQEAIQVLKGMQ
jgi:hypothetical protein